ncbi:MAG: hypothetical protein AB7E60_12650 [Sphingobium sp.]
MTLAAVLLHGAGLALSPLAAGQAVAQTGGGVPLEDSASPFELVPISSEEAAAAEMPEIDGAITAVDEASFDKYFYFRRADTNLATAFADISECDGYARGLSRGLGYSPTYIYTG